MEFFPELEKTEEIIVALIPGTIDHLKAFYYRGHLIKE